MLNWYIFRNDRVWIEVTSFYRHIPGNVLLVLFSFLWEKKIRLHLHGLCMVWIQEDLGFYQKVFLTPMVNYPNDSIKWRVTWGTDSWLTCYTRSVLIVSRVVGMTGETGSLHTMLTWYFSRYNRVWVEVTSFYRHNRKCPTCYFVFI